MTEIDKATEEQIAHAIRQTGVTCDTVNVAVRAAIQATTEKCVDLIRKCRTAEDLQHLCNVLSSEQAESEQGGE